MAQTQYAVGDRIMQRYPSAIPGLTGMQCATITAISSSLHGPVYDVQFDGGAKMSLYGEYVQGYYTSLS
ncbi:hypothetical protein [uncultured Duncaniella sp.]|uniref:hypothetical protein n=1 Tax=uncultured Duncaniella sp. TaxID=2768039 RepID=UPI00262DF3FF|nr:hypothetical protein [uncultured Duncaniella sp.]